MPDVQVRIHLPWSDVSGFICHYAQKAQTVFSFQHEADIDAARTHTHAYFFGLLVKRESLSEAIQKKFNLVGQKEFFTKDNCSKGKNTRSLDISGAYTYGTTENEYPALFTKNISPATLESLKLYAARYWMMHATTKKTHTVNGQHIVIVKHNHKETQTYHIEQIIDIIFAKYETDIESWEKQLSIDAVADEVYEYLKSKNIWCGVMKTHDYIENTLKRMNSQMYKTRVLALWSQKMFRKA